MTYEDVFDRFPTEKSAIDHYLSVEYPGGVVCSRCCSKKVFQETKRWKVFYCNNCRSTFSPFRGTIFEKSSTDFRKWMYCIHLCCDKKAAEVTALNLHADISVTYKTAWRMLNKIRCNISDLDNLRRRFFRNTVK